MESTRRSFLSYASSPTSSGASRVKASRFFKRIFRSSAHVRSLSNDGNHGVASTLTYFISMIQHLKHTSTVHFCHRERPLRVSWQRVSDSLAFFTRFGTLTEPQCSCVDAIVHRSNLFLSIRHNRRRLHAFLKLRLSESGWCGCPGLMCMASWLLHGVSTMLQDRL